MPINYKTEFVEISYWNQLSKLNAEEIPSTTNIKFETKSIREETDVKVITCTRRLTIFETIGAFFELVYLQLFSSNNEIRALLPEAWEALKARDYVQQFVFQQSTQDFLLPEIINKITTYLDPLDLLTLPLVNKAFSFPENTRSAWESVAGRIHCITDATKPIKQEVLTFIHDTYDLYAYFNKGSSDKPRCITGLLTNRRASPKRFVKNVENVRQF